jgi:hypothetical protein
MSSTPKRPPAPDQAASFKLPSRRAVPFSGPATAPRPKSPPRPGRTPVFPDIPREEALNWEDLLEQPKERSTD